MWRAGRARTRGGWWRRALCPSWWGWWARRARIWRSRRCGRSAILRAIVLRAGTWWWRVGRLGPFKGIFPKNYFHQKLYIYYHQKFFGDNMYIYVNICENHKNNFKKKFLIYVNFVLINVKIKKK